METRSVHGPSISTRETFLNLVSFEHPIESELPWLEADTGFRTRLGSLSSTQLWLDAGFKYVAPVSEDFRVRIDGVHSVDFDSEYQVIQTTPEFRLSEQFELLIPVNLWFDKGNMDTGVGVRYRDPVHHIDYVQVALTRADFLVERRSNGVERPEVKSWADTIDLQFHGAPTVLGETGVRFAYQPRAEYFFRDSGRSEKFRRMSGWILHRYDLNETNSLFFRYERSDVDESLRFFSDDATESDFFGDRGLTRARLEYQRTVDDSGVERLRTGYEFARFDEEEDLGAGSESNGKSRRRESIVYAGYRIPLTESQESSLEVTLFLDWLANRYDFPNDPTVDSRDPSFQGKVNFTFQWALAERALFVVNPTFEIDNLDWAGGGVQLRYLF